MSLLSRLFSSSDSKKTTKKAKNGNAQHDAGAGPALAAHSKDAKSSGASGQNPAAAKKSERSGCEEASRRGGKEGQSGDSESHGGCREGRFRGEDANPGQRKAKAALLP